MGTRRSFWTRRSYHRLDVSAAEARPRRFWRIRFRRPRLRLLRRALAAPVRLLARIRDAYVGMMMRLASSGALAGGYSFGDYGGAFARPSGKEYDEKVLVEIYRSLVAQGHVLASKPGVAVPTAQIVAARRQERVPSQSK